MTALFKYMCVSVEKRLQFQNEKLPIANEKGDDEIDKQEGEL